MDLRKLKTILELFEESTTVVELEMKDGESHVRLCKSKAVAALPASAVAAPASAAATETAPPPPAERGTKMLSPMVGTFYRAASPELPPFVRVGQMVEVGQTLCIIEAMKLMNEIPSTVAGRVTEMFLENNAPVGYGDTLFIIE